MMMFAIGLIVTQLSVVLFFWIFRRLALQKHEALMPQKRHDEQLVNLLMDTVSAESASAENAEKFVKQLRDEMRALSARHQHDTRWWFRPVDEDGAWK